MSWQKQLKKERDNQLDELKQFLSIPSVSSLTDHTNDVKHGAEWTADALKRAGMEKVEIMPTERHPVVYGEWMGAEGKPTALIYGHYDVQPVDPLELWDTPPFKPEIRDDKIYARGATDDKGQVFMHIKAIETILHSEGELPLNVKFCIEGEEELGSPHLDDFVKNHQDLLAADVLVVSDNPMLERGKPTVCYGLRGMCGLQIDVFGTDSDLHSGLYGGMVQNPIHALSELLASMHNKDGQITVDGFYDKVKPLKDEEREAYKDLGYDEEEARKSLGAPELFGEKGYSALERTWVRPTLEVNGIFGGFQGEGIKTVIPSEAHAKITCRLVPDQDPADIADGIRKHIDKHTPAGVTVKTTLFDQAKPFVTPFDHPAIKAANQALEKAYGVEPAVIRMGGSIPVVETFSQLLKLPVVMLGFGLPDENLHAPNEHFNLENFDKGLATLCDYWFELAESL